MPESLPLPPVQTEPPVVHINMGREPVIPDGPEIKINMGRSIAGEGLVGMETEIERTVTPDTLDGFLEHIEAGGVFKSHGEPVKAMLKPNGMYDLIDPETGVVKSGNVPKGRLRTRFEAKITEDPNTYKY